MKEGNLKVPPRKIEWDLEVWKALPKDLIENSFELYTANIQNNKLEDKKINYLKEKESCPNGSELPELLIKMMNMIMKTHLVRRNTVPTLMQRRLVIQI